ncbi:MAG TPA: hypothetical protein PKJ08_00075 [Candidatus Cloacimonadota bacterium]|nr:hypothetical protein [Candidatus Cloacimonadota bacterium]
MKLQEMMLIVAKLVQEVYDGTTTALGGTTYAYDTAMSKQNDYFKGGTIWITSGTYSGHVALVTFQDGEGKIMFTPATAGAIAAGVSFSIAPALFNRSMLKIACNLAMIEENYMMKDDSLTTVADQEEYSLPTNVKNIRRVQIASATSSPYKWINNYGWEEINGTLVFDDWATPDGTGYKIRLWYVGKPSEIAESTEINSGIDLEHMQWKAVEHSWRMVLEKHQKDIAIAPDLFNEAKANAEMARVKAGAVTILTRDPKLQGDW